MAKIFTPKKEADQNFLAHTQEFWSKKTGRKISNSDASEIISNFSNFIKFLIDEKKEVANE